MSASLTIEILTPESKRTVEDIAALQVPLIDGSLGVLPGHAPLLAQSIAGALQGRSLTGESFREELPAAGVVQIENNRVTLFLGWAAGANLSIPVRIIREGLGQIKLEGQNARQG